MVFQSLILAIGQSCATIGWNFLPIIKQIKKTICKLNLVWYIQCFRVYGLSKFTSVIKVGWLKVGHRCIGLGVADFSFGSTYSSFLWSRIKVDLCPFIWLFLLLLWKPIHFPDLSSSPWEISSRILSFEMHQRIPFAFFLWIQNSWKYLCTYY